jgi:hypothetical protein
LDHVSIVVDDLQDTIAFFPQYEDKYRLCYMRGPAGIIVALAEELF